jgi:DNA-directed RNA polymerase specialized sigma24 family protein
MDIEHQSVDKMLFEEILARLDELAPELREVGRLRLEGKSETEISNILGIPRATIYTRIKAVEKKILEEFKEF